MPAPSVPASLSNGRGLLMPALGLGTFRAKGERLASAVAYALRHVGVRLIDTAESYKNAADIQAGILRSGVPRGELFLVTKVARENMSAKGVAGCVATQRAALGGAPLDLVLLHWPGTATSNPASKLHAAARLEAWAALQAELNTGSVRFAGVSNFTVAHLEALREAFPDALPSVNQIELHPYNQQRDVVDWCRKHRVVVQSYTTLGRCTEPPKCLYGIREPDHPRLVRDARILDVAARTGMTAPQVLLAWAIRKGFGVIPKSLSHDHILENAESVSMVLRDKLSDEDVLALDSIAGPPDSPEGTVIAYAYPPVKVPL